MSAEEKLQTVRIRPTMLRPTPSRGSKMAEIDRLSSM